MDIEAREDVSLHCTELGNYETLQCDLGLCWCVHPRSLLSNYLSTLSLYPRVQDGVCADQGGARVGGVGAALLPLHQRHAGDVRQYQARAN